MTVKEKKQKVFEKLRRLIARGKYLEAFILFNVAAEKLVGNKTKRTKLKFFSETREALQKVGKDWIFNIIVAKYCMGDNDIQQATILLFPVIMEQDKRKQKQRIKALGQILEQKEREAFIKHMETGAFWDNLSKTLFPHAT